MVRSIQLHTCVEGGAARGRKGERVRTGVGQRVRAHVAREHVRVVAARDELGIDEGEGADQEQSGATHHGWLCGRGSGAK